MLIMIKKSAALLAALFLAYTAAGFFVLPAWLRPRLEQQLSSALKRDVTVRAIKANPFTLSARIYGFSVRDRDSAKPLASFDELYLNVQARSLVRMGLVVKEAALVHPEAHITRLRSGAWNFSDLLGGKKDKPEKKGRPFLFSVGNISIREGRVTLTDMAAGSVHQATGINLTIPFISNIDEFQDIHVEPRFSARINGTLFTLNGRTKPFKDSLETSLNLNLKGISLPFYLGYLPPDLKIRVLSGAMDLDTRLSYVQYKGRKPSLNASGRIAVHDLEVQDAAGGPC
jgi:uncharacterized protein involved in outer membrane biogenesis